MLKALRTLDEILVQSDAKPSVYNPIMRKLYAIAESHNPPPSKDQTVTIFDAIFAELDRATKKFPTWPTDPLHALAVLGEEYGELNKAMLQLTYEPHKTSLSEVRMEAIQTAAMALRLAMSLTRYQYAPCPQHSQQEPSPDPIPISSLMGEGNSFVGMTQDPRKS